MTVRDWTQRKKTAALYKALFLKKSRKTAQNSSFLPKNAFLTISWFFQERCFVEGCGFFVLCSVSKALNLSYQKQHLENFQIFHHKGGPWWFKSYTKGKKGKKKFKIKILNIGPKGTGKRVVEVSTPQVVLSGVLYRTLLTYTEVGS